MKTKIISLAMAVLLLLPAAQAGASFAAVMEQTNGAQRQSNAAPLVSSNRDLQNYSWNWSRPVTSYLVPNSDGTITRVEAFESGVRVETYSAGEELLSAIELPLELPLFGGFFSGAEKNYFVFGQSNPEESDEVEVLRVVRYSKDWQREASVSSYGANTSIPFDAGSLRMAECQDKLYIQTSHQMYQSSDGLNHQANLTYLIRTTDMTILDQISDVSNIKMGYVSHSFNQFMAIDEKHLVTVNHGDAHPRSVVLTRFLATAEDDSFGDYLEKIEEGEYAGWYQHINSKSVDVLPIAEANGVHYNYTGVCVGGFEVTDSAYVVAGNSTLQDGSVSLESGQRNIFVTVTRKDDFSVQGTTLHWLTNYAEKDGVQVSNPQMVKLSGDRLLVLWTEGNTLRYAYLNGEGALLEEIQSESGWMLSDCKPVLQNGEVVWYVTNHSAPKFFRLKEQNAAHVHSYTDTVVAPTCTERGYTVHTCTECGESYADTYVEALGHLWDEGTVTTEPTVEADGVKNFVCTRCGEKRTETLPKLTHEHEYSAQVIAPTCTQEGYTLYTCTCGASYKDNFVPATGHSFVNGKCSVCGEADPNMIRFSDVPEGSWYADAVNWAVAGGVTTGTGNGKFSPEGRCTRAQVVTFLYRAYGAEPVKNQAVGFSDVPAGTWYAEAVAWAVAEGITTGTGNDRFSPDEICTRAQVVTFLYRAEKAKPVEKSGNEFIDVEAGSWYADAVSWAVANNVTGGTGGGRFSPNADCTRAQVVTFLYRSAN